MFQCGCGWCAGNRALARYRARRGTRRRVGWRYRGIRVWHGRVRRRKHGAQYPRYIADRRRRLRRGSPERVFRRGHCRRRHSRRLVRDRLHSRVRWQTFARGNRLRLQRICRGDDSRRASAQRADVSRALGTDVTGVIFFGDDGTRARGDAKRGLDLLRHDPRGICCVVGGVPAVSAGYRDYGFRRMGRGGGKARRNFTQLDFYFVRAGLWVKSGADSVARLAAARASGRAQSRLCVDVGRND